MIKQIILAMVGLLLISSLGYCQETQQPLVLTIKSDRQVYLPGEKIKIFEEIKNISNLDVPLDELLKNSYPSYYFTNAEGKTYKPDVAVNRKTPQVLSSKQSIVFDATFNLSEWKDYKIIGRHSIYMTEGSLISNTITIDIRREVWRLPNEMPLDKDLSIMIKQRIAAINNHNKTTYLQTIHSKCLAGMTTANQDFYDALFNKDLAKIISENYTISVAPIPLNEPLLLEGELEYSVRPTHWVSIDYETAPYHSKFEMWQVIQVGDKWYVVVPKPTQATLEAFRKKAQQKSPGKG